MEAAQAQEVAVSRTNVAVALFLFALLPWSQPGCVDNRDPIARTPPPPVGYDSHPRTPPPAKPLPPPDATTAGPQPFYDEPLMVDTPAEARAFLDIYRRVGSPRILVFVNRTLDGQIVHATHGEGYLAPGQYDKLHARAIDYNMMETLLADWLSADNQVTIISPMAARRRLTDTQVKELESGREQMLSELQRQLNADVLVQVQARPTQQTPHGLALRMLAEAIDLRGGESLARAAVDLTPPLEKVQLNHATRFVARKLMDGMAQTWTAPPPGAPAPPPNTQP